MLLSTMLATLCLLAVIQGLTEFLPISSSGHLVLAERLAGVGEEGLHFVALLHLATVLAVLIYFKKDWLYILKERPQRLILFTVISSLVTGLIGLGAKDYFESTFSDIRLAGWHYLAFGIVMLLFGRTRGQKSEQEAGVKEALLFGLAQAVSILPAVSRSGATIVTLLLLGFGSGAAFRLSFITSLPIIALASLTELDIQKLSGNQVAPSAVAFVLCFVIGLASLALVGKLLNLKRFHWFGWYNVALGVLVLLITSAAR